MPTYKDYYFKSTRSLIPWGATPSGNTTKGVAVIVLSDASLVASTMMGGLQQVITDYHSNRLAGNDPNDMTIWATGPAATGIISSVTGDAFNPYAEPADQYTWAVGLNGGALNFVYGNTGSTHPTSGISATDMGEQIALVKVKDPSGNIDNTKVAIVMSTPGYRSGSDAFYRGPNKAALKFTNSTVPSTVTVTAYPGQIGSNCVTGDDELVFGDVVSVGTC